MALTKENKKGRKNLRSIVEYAEVLGHVSAYPIKLAFKPKSVMEESYGMTSLRGKGQKQYIEVALDEEYTATPHGRDLCVVVLIHELAHAYTWSANERVEEARSFKYGDHGAHFGIVYAQLWKDLMDSPVLMEDDEESDGYLCRIDININDDEDSDE